VSVRDRPAEAKRAEPTRQVGTGADSSPNHFAWHLERPGITGGQERYQVYVQPVISHHILPLAKATLFEPRPGPP
jgi:hypothetical protein